ncbi:MAG TPA: hypothetical protein VIG64_14140 [Actinomycetota bacterium]|jgi:hypothetical protein
MTEGDGIFRQEALAARGAPRSRGGIVRVAPRWTTWAFYALVVLVVAALTGAALVRIDRYAEGPVARDGGRAVVLLPASLAPDVATGRSVELGEADARVVEFRHDVIYPAEARQRYGVEVSVPSVAVVTSAPAATNAEAGRVLVESERALVALIPGLDALFGSS